MQAWQIAPSLDRFTSFAELPRETLTLRIIEALPIFDQALMHICAVFIVCARAIQNPIVWTIALALNT